MTARSASSQPEALETSRLVLRPPGDHDVSLVCAAFRANAARLGRAGDETLTRTATWITGERTARERGERHTFLVLPRNAKRAQLLGHVSLAEILPAPRQSASLGFWVDAAAEGQGIASEAIDAVLGFGFHTLGLERIEAAVAPDNLRSQRVLERLGLTREGVARGYLPIDGVRRDHLVYARLRSDR